MNKNAPLLLGTVTEKSERLKKHKFARQTYEITSNTPTTSGKDYSSLTTARTRKFFADTDIYFEDKRTESPLELYIRKENIASIRKAMLCLTDKRRELIHKAFFEEKTFRAIARKQGLSKSAISQQMKTVYKHLRKHLGA